MQNKSEHTTAKANNATNDAAKNNTGIHNTETKHIIQKDSEQNSSIQKDSNKNEIRLKNSELKNTAAENNTFDIDKARFGEFVSTQRKKMGYTQKELARRLFLSDKAVSKWERGISLPDISLLIPLAGILNVTVTELLEGKTADCLPDMNAGHVEDLLKKTLTYSAQSPDKLQKQKRKLRVIFGICMTAVIFEWTVFHSLLNNNLITMQLLGVLCAAYVLLGAKDRLPAYFDENKISCYSDGIFRMNCPGISFNNSSWPYILLSLRIWSVLQAAVLPMCYLCASRMYPGLWHSIGLPVELAFCLGGLFAPVYILGRKYS